MHKQLLISIALQFWLLLHTLSPCFFDNSFPGVGFGFVEGGYVVEIYVLVEGVLEGGGYVVAVVVGMAGVVVFVVAVGGHFDVFWGERGSLGKVWCGIKMWWFCFGGVDGGVDLQTLTVDKMSKLGLPSIPFVMFLLAY
jgi:hypothetical protein